MLAIIETDHYNPIQIMNLSTQQIINTIPVNDIIKEAYFFDLDSTIVVVFGQNSFVMANLTSNQQYSMPPITATSYAADQNGSIFTCHNNMIFQYGLNITEAKIN